MTQRARAGRLPACGGGLAVAIGIVLATTGVAAGMHEAHEGDRGAIRITSTGLEPAEYVVERGEVPAWANEQEQRVVLSFPAEVADDFTCDDLRPNLYEDGAGHLVSLAIRSQQFRLPCPLAPGEYDYQVHRIRVPAPPGAPIVPQAPEAHPDHTLTGRLVVR